MWPFRKKARPGRLGPRRVAPATKPSLWQRGRAAGAFGSLALGLAFYLAVLLMDVLPLDPVRYRIRQYVPTDITARVRFDDLLKDELAEALGDARLTAPAVFRANTALIDEIERRIESVPARAQTATRPADLGEDLPELFALNSENDLAAWKRYADEEGAQRLQTQLGSLREALLQTCIVRAKDEGPQRAAPEIVLVAGEARRTVSRSRLGSLDQRQRIREEVVPGLVARLDEPIRPSVTSYLVAVFSQDRPIYRYDDAETQKAVTAAAERVRRNPPQHCYKVYKPGEIDKPGDLLVPRSRKQTPEGTPCGPLTEEGLRLLGQEHAKYLADERLRAPWARWVRVLGRSAILLIVTLLMGGYIVRYEPALVRDHWRGFAVIAVMLLMLAVTKLLDRLGANPYTATLPILMAVFILVIAHDQRFALAMGSILSMYVVLQMRADLVLLVVLVAAAAVSAAQLREVRTRNKLIKVSAAAAAVVFAGTWAYALSTSVPWTFALADSLWGAGAALLAGFLIQGILPVIERAFGIATSMTLLEWCDPSKPLLQRLRTGAPGTYNHSLQLGSMSEAAAEAIDARGLVARVGAYYHDIGKMNKPEYFVENSNGAANKHEKLSPAMSLLIITGHVKDGLELAREYSLPRLLHEFIATHHGTTLVQYFYQAATERRKADTERAPDELEFRYPGPKPHSREAAILMLADASESSVRAMPEPTPGRIESQVHTMVSRRLMDGQLDECDLTLKEVHAIETSLVKSLCAIYHARIPYPAPNGQKPTAAEAPAEKPDKTPREAHAERRDRARIEGDA